MTALPKSPRAIIHSTAMEMSGALPVELDALVRKEIPRWAKVIKDNNIKSGD